MSEIPRLKADGRNIPALLDRVDTCGLKRIGRCCQPARRGRRSGSGRASLAYIGCVPLGKMDMHLTHELLEPRVNPGDVDHG